jgi:predicted nucleic acid-binding protein
MIGPIEIANALLGAVRRGRMTGQHRSRAIRQLDALPIERDTETLFHAWTTTLELAERHRLTVYDACYLELAQRRGLPLATLDRELHHAGKKLGLELLGI